MSSTIKIKRSNQSGNAPDTNNIVEGELALNTADGVLYSRGGNDIFEVGSNLTNADIDALLVNDSAKIHGKLYVSPSTASDTIQLGSTTQTGTISLGLSNATNTINVGNGATANGSIQTVNIGGGNATDGETIVNIACIDSGDTTVKIGDPDGPASGIKIIRLAGNVTTSNGNFYHNGNQFTVSPSNTSSSILIGGNTHTGIINLGMGQGTQTTAVAGGNVASGSTKTLKLGTSGAAGSTTNIEIGNDDSASTTTLQGVTKIDQLAPRVITPAGDNSISDVATSGKHVKIATIDLGASGESYKVNFEVNYNGSGLPGLGQEVTRHTLILTSQGIGSSPAAQVTSFYNDVQGAASNGTFTEIKAKRIADVAGDGSGPVRLELYLIGKESNCGMNVYVRDEFVAGGASLRSDVTWYESPDETDYLTSTEFANQTGNLVVGAVGVGFNTKSNNMDDLFGTTAGIVKTTGGNSTSAISAVALSEGFLHYDSATETFSHTFDMLPSDPATSITIGDSNGTGVLSLGTSKVQQTVNINAGVGITNSSVKQTNISTGQTDGSCDINIGPTDNSVTSLVDILGTINIAGNRTSDTITIGGTSQVGTITLGQSTATNTINIGTGEMEGFTAQYINIGNNKGTGNSIIRIGDNDASSGLTQVVLGCDKVSAGSFFKVNNTSEFRQSVTMDSDLTVDGTINGKYDTLFAFSTSVSMSGSDFSSNSGKKIIKTRTDACTIQEFQPTADDIGKHWTIINATTASTGYVTLNFANQYIRLMSGNSASALADAWRLGRSGVAELVCIAANANGGSSTTPNFILYGNNLVTI